jgi:aminocarboxymuconate-semialdehyde decarboxylase
MTGAAGLYLSEGRIAWTQERTASRREVSVGGQRVRVIDVHAHCIILEVQQMLGEEPEQDLIVGNDRLRAMDAQGIDVEVLSINRFRYELERGAADKAIPLQAEKLAAICKAQPDRFAGLITVSLQHPDLAVQQLEWGMKSLGLKGAAIGASVNADDLAAPKFDPFWAKCIELDAPIFMHPSGVPELEKRLQGPGFLTNVIGNPLETTIALSKLIFEGKFDQFPGLKLCSAHAGGYLPSYADRSDYGYSTRPQRRTKVLKKMPTAYLKELYFDSLIFTGEALRHLAAVVGPSRIVLGTDHPYPWTTTAVDHVLGTPGLTDADKVGILGGNAATLLKI